MKNIVLAAGYATRMYPLTEHFPKPLLEIQGVSLLDRLMADIDTLPEINEHLIVTNHRFASTFQAWKEKSTYQKPIRILDDGSTNNENRCGAVGDLLFVLRTCKVEDDVMVLAADNLLDFPLRGFVDYFAEKDASVIMTHEETSLAALQRTGVACVDNNGQVILMQEKPERPLTTHAVPPFYIYHKRDLPLILHSLEKGYGYDSPGNLAQYLTNLTVLYAWPMPGTRTDIGNLETYLRLKG